jgi:hypothetical protein
MLGEILNTRRRTPSLIIRDVRSSDLSVTRAQYARAAIARDAKTSAWCKAVEDAKDDSVGKVILVRWHLRSLCVRDRLLVVVAWTSDITCMPLASVS